MKKDLQPATTPFPKFRSDEEAADYFQKHSVARIWNQQIEDKTKTSKALAKSIRERHEARKSAISIQLDAAQIAAAKRSRLRNRSDTRRSCGCG